MRKLIFLLGMAVGSFGNQTINVIMTPAQAGPVLEMASAPADVRVVEMPKPAQVRRMVEVMERMRLPIVPPHRTEAGDEIEKLIRGL